MALLDFSAYAETDPLDIRPPSVRPPTMPQLRPKPQVAVKPAALPDFSAFAEPPDFSALAEPVAETPTTPAGIGDYIKETGKGFARAVTEMTGLTAQGLAALDTAEMERTVIDVYRDDLVGVPSMKPDEVAALRKRIIDEVPWPVGEAMGIYIDEIQSGKRSPETIANWQKPTRLPERSLYKSGTKIREAGRATYAPKAGWEQSLTATLSEGVGTFLTGIPIAMLGRVPGALAVFGSIGIGEAADRAVQYDKGERKAGRTGLTDQQLITAAVLGIAPGTTDIIPIEVLMAGFRVPLPLRRPLARAIARVGGQAFVEGVQEAGQEYLQNLIAQTTYDPTQELTENVVPSGELGAGVGGIAGGLTEIVHLLGGRRGGRA